MKFNEFSLLKEDSDSYTIGHPKGKSMRIPKRGLSDVAQKLISKLRREQHFADGSEPIGEQSAQATAPAEELVIPVNTSTSNAYNPEEYNKTVAMNAPASGPVVSTPASAELQGNIKGAQDNPTLTPLEASNNTQGPQAPQSPLPQNMQGLEAAHKEIQEEQAQLNQAQKQGQYQIKDLPDFNTLFNKYQGQDNILRQAYESKQIDPERYLSKMDTGSRIAAGIAVALSGIGSGLTGQQNMAQQQINQAIAQDIDAQRNDQSKAMNLWKMNRELLGSDVQANLATENQKLNYAHYKMGQAQQNTSNALSKQRLTETMQGIENQISTNNWMRSRLGGGAPGTEQQHLAEMDVMQQLRPDFFKDMQSKYLPGIGVGRVPLTAENKTAFQAYDEMQKAVNDAKSFIVDQGAVLNPLGSASAAAQGKRSAISLAMNKLNGLNRLNETELKAFTDMVSGIGGLNSTKATAQMDELTNQIQRKRRSEMDALGVIPFKQAPSVDQAKVWARQNISSTDPATRQKAMQIAQMVGGD